MPAQLLDCAFTQETGIALASLGEVNDLLGDGSVDVVVFAAFRRATQAASKTTPRMRRVWRRSSRVQEWCSGMARPPSLRRGRDQSLRTASSLFVLQRTDAGHKRLQTGLPARAVGARGVYDRHPYIEEMHRRTGKPDRAIVHLIENAVVRSAE